jgi:hypothetical protein
MWFSDDSTHLKELERIHRAALTLHQHHLQLRLLRGLARVLFTLASQRSTRWREIECLVPGSRTSTSSTVAGPIFSSQGSALKRQTPWTTASYSVSACASPILRPPCESPRRRPPAAQTKTVCLPTTLTPMGEGRPATNNRTQLFVAEVRSGGPIDSHRHTVGRPQPSMRRRPSAAAVSDGYAVAKVILNDMLVR